MIFVTVGTIPPFGRNPESAAAEFLPAGGVGVIVKNTKTG